MLTEHNMMNLFHPSNDDNNHLLLMMVMITLVITMMIDMVNQWKDEIWPSKKMIVTNVSIVITCWRIVRASKDEIHHFFRIMIIFIIFSLYLYLFIILSIQLLSAFVVNPRKSFQSFKIEKNSSWKVFHSLSWLQLLFIIWMSC